MAHQLNEGQLAALLQHWNHPIIKSLLTTTCVGIGSVVFYQNRDRIDMKRIAREMHRFIEPNRMLGPYVPKEDTRPFNSDLPSAPATEERSLQRVTTSPTEQRSLPDILSDAAITARTDSSILPGILDNLAQPSTIGDFTDLSQAIASAPCIPCYNFSTHTIGVPQQPQEVSGVVRVSGFLAIAAVAGGALLVYKKTTSNQKERESDAELIAWLQQTKCAVEVELEAKGRVMESLRTSHDEAMFVLNGKIADLEHQIESLLQLCSNARNDNVQLRNNLDANDDEMQKLCVNHATAVAMLNEQVAGLSAQLETLKKEREEARKHVTQLGVYPEAKNGEIQKLGTALAAKEDSIPRLDAEHTKHVGALDVKLAHLLSQLGALAKEQEQIRNQNVQQAKDPGARGGVIAELTKERDETIQHNKNLPRQLSIKGGHRDPESSPSKNDDDDRDNAENDNGKNSSRSLNIEKYDSADTKNHDHLGSSHKQDQFKDGHEQSPYDSKTASDASVIEATEQPVGTEAVVVGVDNDHQKPADGDLRPGFTIPLENIKAIRNFGPVPPHNMRKRRTVLLDNFKRRNALSNPADDNKLIPLELPCNDKYYRGLGIPKPLASIPENADQEISGKKVYDQCTGCHEWYTMLDRRDHQGVCIEFFVYATYCHGCGKIFVNNKAWREGHLPCCGTLVPKLPICRHCKVPFPDTAHILICGKKLLLDQKRICVLCKESVLEVVPPKGRSEHCNKCRIRLAEERTAANSGAPRGPRGDGR